MEDLRILFISSDNHSISHLKKLFGQLPIQIQPVANLMEAEELVKTGLYKYILMGAEQNEPLSEDKIPDTLSFGDLRLELSAHRVYLKNNELHLTLTEYKILKGLTLKPNKVLSRESIQKMAFNNARVSNRTIDVHMCALRRKLGALGEKILTVRGVGYRLEIGI